MAQAADGGYAKIHGHVCQRLPVPAGSGLSQRNALCENGAVTGNEEPTQCADQWCSFHLYVHQLRNVGRHRRAAGDQPA